MTTRNAIGLIELTSIASGYLAADGMLKAADVELVLCRSICSGKFMTMVSGDVAAVKAAVQAGLGAGAAAVIDSFVIANLHPSVIPALSGMTQPGHLDALGVIESFSVASLIEAADRAVKTAAVELLEIRLAMALGGKAFATLTGPVEAVQAAIDAGGAALAAKGLLVNSVVIPRPRAEVFREMI